MLDRSQKISKSSANSRPSAPAPAQSRGGSAGTALPPRQTPSPEQLRTLLTSPEGQALLRLLQADGGAGLRTAAEAMRAGNLEGVKSALSPLLAGTEAETLTRSLEEKL